MNTCRIGHPAVPTGASGGWLASGARGHARDGHSGRISPVLEQIDCVFPSTQRHLHRASAGMIRAQVTVAISKSKDMVPSIGVRSTG